MRHTSAKPSWAMLILILLLVSTVVALPRGASNSTVLPLPGGELRVAVEDPPNLNPLAASATDEESWSFIDLVYDSLARIDPDTLLPIPWMASDWSIAGDLVTVDIRQGIQWHGGGELTADDVVYSLTASGGLRSNARYSSLLSGLSGTAVSTYRVQFDLSGYANRGRFFQEVLTLPIVPDGFAGSSAPNGTGPFMAASLRNHIQVVDGEYLVANASDGQQSAELHYAYVQDGLYDDYLDDLTLFNNNTTSVGFTMNWPVVQFSPPLEHNMSVRAYYSFNTQYLRLPAFDGFFKPNQPYLDAVNLTFFPDDGATPEDEAMDGAAKALIDGALDFITWPIVGDEATAFRWEGTPFQASISSFKEFSPDFTFMYLGMNNAASHAPLDDPTLRQAIARLLDKDLYLEIEPNTAPADSVVLPINAFWYNTSVPQYRVPKQEVSGRPESVLDGINRMLDVAGYLDRDNDGWRDMPGAPYDAFNFTLFSITDNVDPRKAIVGSNINDNLHKVGINADLVAETPQQIQARIDSDDFDLYLQQITVRGDPSFMVDLFHGNVSNPVNADDPELNRILDLMEASVDQNVRRQYAMDAQGWVAVNAHLAPILHYEMLNAREKEVYQGWVSTAGGLHNYWTYLGLNQIPAANLVVDVSTFETSLSGNETADVAVKVTDQNGFPVADVQLTISVSAGGTLNRTTGTTDTTGAMVEELVVQGEPTDVVRDVSISVLGEKPAYASAVGTWQVTVHPEMAQMDVVVTRSPLVIGEGTEATIFVNVTDRTTLAPVPNATVVVTVKPDGVGEALDPSQGTTDSSGAFTATFVATVAIDSTFTITAKVTAEGYADAEAKTFVRANRRAPPVPGLDAVALVGIVVLLAVGYARWQRRRRE